MYIVKYYLDHCFEKNLIRYSYDLLLFNLILYVLSKST